MSYGKAGVGTGWEVIDKRIKVATACQLLLFLAVLVLVAMTVIKPKESTS